MKNNNYSPKTLNSKELYESPQIEIIVFIDQMSVTTSFTFDEYDDGGLYNDKW